MESETKVDIGQQLHEVVKKKLPYHPPRLQCHGSVSQLTAGGGSNGNEDYNPHAGKCVAGEHKRACTPS